MSNAHIKDYLSYYIGLATSPGYAVMINGAWGIGKTHFIRGLVKDLKANGKSVFWVSLNGVKSAEDVDQRLAISAATLLNPDVAELGSRIGTALIKKFGMGDLLKATDILRIKKPDLLVFDDLERGGLKAVELLAYINQFVELEESKVLIIANETEINKHEPDFKTAREKVIGESFDLQIDVPPALESFLLAMPSKEAQKYVNDNASTLLSIFQQAECNNLRVLKQVLLAWDRFYAAIDEKLRARAEPMLVVFKLFAALCIEVRLGHLTAGDLRDRVNSIVVGLMKENKENPTPLAGASQKFPEIYLHDTVLNDDVLVHVICEGRVDGEEINSSLRHSAYFLAPDEEPAWQTVWYGIEREPEQFRKAFETMERQFKERAFLKAGEILHVFGLRLWGAEIGQLDLKPDEVVAQCQSYVDDLARDGRILESDDIEDDFRSGAYGLGFNAGDKVEFRELTTYCQDAVAEARRRRWPTDAASVMDLMAADASAFFAKVCWTNDSRENTFAAVPIFSCVAAPEFVERLLKLKPADFRTAMTALKGRYEGRKLDNDLAPERSWLREVRDLLLEKAKVEVPIRRFAIRNEVARLISPLLKEKSLPA